MRKMLLVVVLSGAFGGSIQGQSMVEMSAAAAGGTAGGVAGKKVSDGLTKIFEKVDKQTGKAAKAGETKKPANPDDANTPLLEVGPGVPKGSASMKPDPSNVPPPPPIHRASVHKPAPPPAPVVVVEPPPPVPAPPPPPEITAADLKTLTNGMRRDVVLQMGLPSARITMVEDGHLLEIFRYQGKEATLGIVRLTDGAVSNVVIR